MPALRSAQRLGGASAGRPSHICAGTGRALPRSAPGVGLTPPTSAPGRTDGVAKQRKARPCAATPTAGGRTGRGTKPRPAPRCLPTGPHAPPSLARGVCAPGLAVSVGRDDGDLRWRGGGGGGGRRRSVGLLESGLHLCRQEAALRKTGGRGRFGCAAQRRGRHTNCGTVTHSRVVQPVGCRPPVLTAMRRSTARKAGRDELADPI